MLGEFPRMTRIEAVNVIVQTEAKNKGWITDGPKFDKSPSPDVALEPSPEKIEAKEDGAWDGLDFSSHTKLDPIQEKLLKASQQEAGLTGSVKWSGMKHEVGSHPGHSHSVQSHDALRNNGAIASAPASQPSSSVEKSTHMMRAFRVSEVFSPDNFFVQDKDDLEKLEKLLEEMSSFYIKFEQEGRLDELRVPPIKCQLGMWVAAVWGEDNHWYRAKILKITSLTAVELQFVDFGNRMSCNKSELFKLVEPFSQTDVPAFATQAKLSGIKPYVGKKYSKAASDRFQKLTDSNTVLLGQILGSNENGRIEVKLTIDGGEVDVGDTLIKERWALPRIKADAANVRLKFPSDLPKMLDDLTIIMSKCQIEISGHQSTTIEGLKEEMEELKELFERVDEKSVHAVLKKQINLAQKLLIIGMEISQTQEDFIDENNNDPRIQG